MRKTCRACRVAKSLDDFHKKKSGAHGRRPVCKGCRAVETRERYRQWRERILESNRQYAQTPRGRIVGKKAKAKHKARVRDVVNAKLRQARRIDIVPWMLYAARMKSRRRGWVCDLTHDDLVLPDRCPALGIPLMVGEGKLTQNSPSLDRIDNSKGYVRGNVVIVSFRANAIKNDATVAELGRVYEFYRKLEQKRIDAAL